MQIQDSSPERRNLIILSISIIVFYLAGGELVDSSVRLQVVNITFSKPEVLANLVWLLLLWFCYRYWLIMQGSWKEGFKEEVFQLSIPSIYYLYLVKKFNLPNNFTNAFHKDKHWLKMNTDHSCEHFQVQHIFKVDGRSQNSKYENMSTKIDKLIIITYIVYLFFRRPTLSTYAMPYFLFTTALALGIFNAL